MLYRYNLKRLEKSDAATFNCVKDLHGKVYEVAGAEAVTVQGDEIQKRLDVILPEDCDLQNFAEIYSEAEERWVLADFYDSLVA